jgi:hypothetical protein
MGLQPLEDGVERDVVGDERDMHRLDVLGVEEIDRELGTDSYWSEAAAVRDLAVEIEETRQQAGSVESGAPGHQCGRTGSSR